MNAFERCDKKGCTGSVTGVVTVSCMNCGKVYSRCALCGGEDSANRSLKSHRGLFHPRNDEATR